MQMLWDCRKMTLTLKTRHQAPPFDKYRRAQRHLEEQVKAFTRVCARCENKNAQKDQEKEEP